MPIPLPGWEAERIDVRCPSERTARGDWQGSCTRGAAMIPRATSAQRLGAVSFLLLTPLGCGSAGQPFSGLYAAAGTVHLSIQELGNLSSPVPDTFRVSEGTASELVLADSEGRCFLLADLEGEVALLRRGASCSWSDNGITFTLTLMRGTVSLSGGSGRFDMAGGVTATARGKMYPGSFFQNATLTRVGE
jgi:hypothetical protein